MATEMWLYFMTGDSRVGLLLGYVIVRYMCVYTKWSIEMKKVDDGNRNNRRIMLIDESIKKRVPARQELFITLS